MRNLILSLTLLSLLGCRDALPAEPVREVYRSGRDALCLVRIGDSLRAGLIVYGPGDVNCSASGAATEIDGELTIVPRGDESCRIPVRFEGSVAVIGQRTAQCGYYCGPGADYSGRRLEKSGGAEPVTDLAGEPLC